MVSGKILAVMLGIAALGGVAIAAPPGTPPGQAKNAPKAAPPGQVKTPPGLAKKPGGLPPGQAKKIWGRGERLPTTYFTSTYYIQPTRYRLPAAPPGSRWVLVDDRAYLAQTQTGLISQVVQIAAALLR